MTRLLPQLPQLLLILCAHALISLPAIAQNMRLTPPPEVIIEKQIQHIKIITQAELEIAKLPPHPKVTWLGTSSVRLQNNSRRQMQIEHRLEFIANSPGLLEFPPIPVVLENKEFFIRLDDIRVIPNRASKTDTRLLVYWNEKSEIPKKVHLGEAVEIKFVQLVRKTEENSSIRPYFSPPSNRVLGGQWHPFTREETRKPYPSDPYPTLRN